MSERNPKVDEYINKATQWRDEMKKIREIALECGLSEDLKWGKPCYRFENNNVVIIQGFKKYFALLFFKGVLLKDPKGILQKAGDNMLVGRQIRFTDVREIKEMEPVVKAYIHEAVEVEKAGLKADVEEVNSIDIPVEFQNKLDHYPGLKPSFEALTPGRQRAYLIYFSGAKQSATREARIEKYIPKILEGKGMSD